jgi:hypothetical protein
MKMKTTILSVAALIVTTLVFFGCGSQNKQGLAELERIEGVAHGLEIAVSAGVSQEEYSRRVNDALISVGDLEESARTTLPKFPARQREAVKDIYAHLSQSLEAYKAAKCCFGDTHAHDVDPLEGDNRLTAASYEALRGRLPSLAADTAFHGSDEFGYWAWKGDVLQALWRVAADERAKARESLDKLR